MENMTTPKSKALKLYKKPTLKKMGSVRKLTLKAGSKFDSSTMNNDFS